MSDNAIVYFCDGDRYWEESMPLTLLPFLSEDLALKITDIALDPWISIDDRLPLIQDYQSDFHSVDVWVTDEVNCWATTFSIGGNHIGKPWEGFEPPNSSIKRWMPLPEAK